MTVCISAISESGYIFNLADREVSLRGMTYKPGDSKIQTVKNSVQILLAGHMDLQMAILEELKEKFAKEATVEVEEVVDAYIESYNSIYFRHAESEVFVPHQLTANDYLSKESSMRPELVTSIEKKVAECYEYYKSKRGVEAIVAGIDDSQQPSLFILDNNEAENLTSSGFAAIGAGARKAEAKFVAESYNRDVKVTDALMIAFSAKKLSEVIDDVGPSTDITMINRDSLYPQKLTDEALNILGDMYEKMVAEIKMAEQNRRAALLNKVIVWEKGSEEPIHLLLS